MFNLFSNPKNITTIEELRELYDNQIERRIALWNIFHEENKSFEVARKRELSAWEFMSGISCATIFAFASHISRNRLLVIPIAPLIMGAGYRIEECFGKHASSIKEAAEEILNSNKDQVTLVGPPITLKELDERRRLKTLVIK